MQAGDLLTQLFQGSFLKRGSENRNFWKLFFCHIFTKQPDKPMFSGTLNTMSAIILAKLQSFGAKI